MARRDRLPGRVLHVASRRSRSSYQTRMRTMIRMMRMNGKRHMAAPRVQ